MTPCASIEWPLGKAWFAQASFGKNISGNRLYPNTALAERIGLENSNVFRMGYTQPGNGGPLLTIDRTVFELWLGSM